MKRTIRMLLTVLMLMGALVGCQQTPDNPIVVGKNLDNLLEKAQDSGAIPESNAQPEAAAAEDENSILLMNLGIPQNLKLENVSAKGKLHVHMDASIILPQAEKMPIASVKMSRLTNDTVKRLVETLFDGAQTVSDDLSLLPKAYHDNIIKDLMANVENEMWFNERYLEQAEYDASLASAMQSLENAPTQATYEPLQYQFDNPAEDGKYVHYYALQSDGSLSRINVYTESGSARLEYFRNTDDSCLDILLGRAIPSPDSTSVESIPLHTIQSEVLKTAEAALNKMGFDDFECTGVRQHKAENIKPDGIYEFMFTRAVNDIPVTYTDDGGGDRKILYEGEKFAKPWLYEKIRVFIDDNGIAMFEYCSPHELMGIELEGATLLPFSSIQAIFEKMIVIVDNEYDTSEEEWTCEYFIDHVTLGLMRLTERDVGSQGLLIPVWDFFGRSIDSYGIERGTSGYTSLLTINAIDGSIIDRFAGY
ncbi:MAG: DUF6034 family protein [Clostridia bacterium]